MVDDAEAPAGHGGGGDRATHGQSPPAPDRGTHVRRAWSSLRSPAVRRSGWVFVDQAVSSLTNLAATIVVARAVSGSLFGSFAIALVVYRLIVGIARALVAEPLAIRVSARPDQLPEVRAAAGAAVVCGMVSGVVVVVVGIGVDGPVGPVLIVTGVMMPALVLQDIWRFALFTVGEPQRAVVNDLVWAAIQVVFLVVVLSFTSGSIVLVVAAWGGGAVASALLGARQAGGTPAMGQAMGYLRRHLALGWRYTVEMLCTNGATQLTIIAVAFVVSTAGVGAVQGGATLFGPLTVVLLGVMAAGIPEGSRLLARAPHRVAPVLVGVSVAMVGLAASWGVVLASLPPAWGRGLLGDTWPLAREVVLPFTVATTGTAAASGAMLGLRVLAAASATLTLRLVTGPVTVLVGVIGASAWGASGAVWGIALGTWMTAVGSWYLLGRFRREHPLVLSQDPDQDPSAPVDELVP